MNICLEFNNRFECKILFECIEKKILKKWFSYKKSFKIHVCYTKRFWSVYIVVYNIIYLFRFCSKCKNKPRWTCKPLITTHDFQVCPAFLFYDTWPALCNSSFSVVYQLYLYLSEHEYIRNPAIHIYDTNLEMKYDRPYEAQSEFRIAVYYIFGADVHKFDLWKKSNKINRYTQIKIK